LLTVPLQQWIQISLVCGLGDRATGKYSLTVTLPGAPPRRFTDLPCSPQFTSITWMGFVSDATEPSVFYLDDVHLEAQK